MQQVPLLQQLIQAIDNAWINNGYADGSIPRYKLLAYNGKLYAVLEDHLSVYRAIGVDKHIFMATQSNCIVNNDGVYICTKLQRISCSQSITGAPAIDIFGINSLQPLLQQAKDLGVTVATTL